MKLKVAIVEDDDSLRNSLAVLINGSPGLVCAGSHTTAEQALSALGFENPDVLLLDLALPGMSGEALLAQTQSRWPKLEILVLTVQDEPKRIYKVLEAGASGYLIKPVAPAKLLDAISEVAAGGAPMSTPVARLVLETFRERSRQKQALEQLTAREEEVLDLLARGCRYQEIARQLQITRRTVGSHLHHIYEKLHVRSRAEAAARYLTPPHGDR